MKRAGERSADLTRQLLAFDRQSPLEATRVDLGAAVDATVRMVKRIVPENVVMTVKREGPDRGVEAEPGQIEQILVNLLINARDAMPEGGTIAIATTNVHVLEGESKVKDSVPPGRYAKLSVRDSGTGMAEAILEHIFEPFFTTKEQGKGTGLGLSTVFGIVHRCNGYIFVESKVGTGTIFSVYLPEWLVAEDLGGRLDDTGHLPSAGERAIAKERRGTNTAPLIGSQSAPER
jgi:signal transduction histidine kinase